MGNLVIEGQRQNINTEDTEEDRGTEQMGEGKS
jgi:hypothetical protein